MQRRAERDPLNHMARISIRCPGTSSKWSCFAQMNGCTSKILLALVPCVCVIIIIITVIQNYSIQRHERALLNHAPPRPRTDHYTAVTNVQDNSLHYGVVFDCGSSGSRVYVYVWPQHSGNPRELLKINPMVDEDKKPVSKKITPGLSTFGKTPSKASEYLRPLLEYAAKHVPKDKHKETPLYILATAGMRMLPQSQQDAILEALRTDIPIFFNFQFAADQIGVISGKEEGVYAWIAINYILGRFEHGEDDDPLIAVDPPGAKASSGPHVRKRTVGMMDMGGGSMQIAYEVPKSEEIAKTLISEFNLGCRKTDLDHNYRTYVTTFLGYGANAARDRYHKVIVDIAKRRNLTSFYKNSPIAPILDPCRPFDLSETYSVNGTSYHFLGTGNYTACKPAVIPLLNLTAHCVKEPCSINGIYQPPINFYNSEFYGFSEFWYSSDDVLRLGGKYDYYRFEKAAKDYCALSWKKILDFKKQNYYPKADDERLRTQCFKSAWMSTTLHVGFKFPKTYKHFRSAQVVYDKDVQWTLGALLFRIRYLPLREVEKVFYQHFRPPWVDQPFYMTFLPWFCIAVVIIAILLYWVRLNRMRGRPLPSESHAEYLRSIPSMAYFMTEEDEMEMGVKVLPAMPDS
ncbi:ectonucleoside triphosphate diphosphohydrolase 4 isoform X2 [Lingula anatina]|uniref:Ectonucleoside triphosphate diphosphohydrolase 4 isoform X2 n=1 Tax=Lingula anatina TaxID=7574 RepID=A0A1S3JVR0_LINAN|nr:ectonucleoside triphosphate diphosphohydrolase 4 isoform X2 [Lingula anatina]|eukprot:XP_013414146.1 ectonucleoside triphosphate diphosphohydrolase 4 isoform X2 [Lingula anatina]